MSGVTPLPVAAFRRRIRGELTLSHLATLSGLGRSHVSQVPNGHLPGGRTWPVLWETVEMFAPFALVEFDELEQWATWNSAPQPAFLVETEAGLAVHRAASAPALASDREIGAEHFAPSRIVFSCRVGAGERRAS